MNFNDDKYWCHAKWSLSDVGKSLRTPNSRTPICRSTAFLHEIYHLHRSDGGRGVCLLHFTTKDLKNWWLFYNNLQSFFLSFTIFTFAEYSKILLTVVEAKFYYGRCFQYPSRNFIFIKVKAWFVSRLKVIGPITSVQKIVSWKRINVH